jgi:cytochrome c2
MISWLALIVAAVIAQAGGPNGSGAAIAAARCLSCHEADLIESQRLSRAGWTREIDKMIRWGALVTEAEREPLTAYVSERIPSAPASSRLRSGEAVNNAACLACHEADLIQQQRLSRPAWVREVDKMIRWGAPVPPADKDVLVDYLAAKFAAPDASAK